MSRSSLNIASLALLIGLSSDPASAQPQWYKGNLHTHTFWSDGDDFPEMVVAWYVDHGYDFLSISDHNTLNQGEKWISMSSILRRGGESALPRYRERFGDDWIATRGEGETLEVRLKTLDQVREHPFVPSDFLLLEAEEISDQFDGLPVHINATNLNRLIEPQGGDSIRQVIRRNLIAIESQAEESGRPVLGHVNHPNYYYAITAEDMAHVLEEQFFEVFNGHPSVNVLGDREHLPVSRLWDIANTIRIADLKAPPLLGIATDDSHNYHAPEGAVPGRGWVMVRAETLDAESLIAALRSGDFYASTGVVLHEVIYDDDADTLTVEIEPRDEAQYVTQFIGTRREYDDASEPVLDEEGRVREHITRRYSRDVGAVLAEVSGTRAVYHLRGDELYVRAMIMSTRPVEFPVAPGQRCQAWTQPVGWTEPWPADR